MALKLPKLLRSEPIIEGVFPSLSFHKWWQKVTTEIENQEEMQNQIITDLQEAQEALEATQQELVTTQAELAQAQTDLADAQADIVTAFDSILAVADALNGFAPLAGATFTGAVDVQAALSCDSLRIDQVPSASTATTTHKVPISLNGITFYILLSNS
jgi:hypothetical protein